MCVCVCLVDVNITTHGDRLTPLLVAALYSVKNSIVWMLGQKDCAEIQTSAVSASGQNALHLVVQNQQCEYSLEVLLYIHTLSLVIVTDCLHCPHWPLSTGYLRVCIVYTIKMISRSSPLLRAFRRLSRFTPRF